MYESHTAAQFWLEQYGTAPEKRALAQTMEFFERALRARNAREIERQLRSMRRIGQSAYLRAPQVWSWELDEVVQKIPNCSDPKRAQRLLQQGRKAEDAGNRRELERVVREIWTLFPADQEERSLSYDSGVK